MKRFPAYLVVLALAVGLSLASCGKKERVIPREKMAEIYAEMYVLDQWLDENRSLRREADTSLVYAPVLDKYGYTYDDYLNSVNVYMKDPTRYSRILRRTSEILGSRLTELKVEKKAQQNALKESRRLDSLMNSMVRTAPSDSLVTVLDSLGFVDFRFVQTSDTTYDGPAMVIRRDSLAVVADSLTVLTDTLPEKKNPQNARVDGTKSEVTRKESGSVSVKTDLIPESRSADGQPSFSSVKRRILIPTRDTLIKIK